MAEHHAPPLILASGSLGRRQMLGAAGVSFTVVPSKVDERAVREALEASGDALDPADVAEVLARAKAEDVSRTHPQALVIGGDQVLALGRRIFEKPADLCGARTHLLELSGATHELHAAVALAQNGEIVWCHTDCARLTMRKLSPRFVDDYLVHAGDSIIQSVGAYQIEGLGSQLFERIEGDYFTIFGMPLIALLGELRARKQMPT